MSSKKNILENYQTAEQKQLTKVNYRTALMLLVTTMIGVGYLTIPATLRETGLIPGLFLIILTAGSTLYGSFMLSKAYCIYPTENYPDLVYKILG